MARKAMITRGIASTLVTTLCINIQTCEPFNQVVTLTGDQTKAKNLETQVRTITDVEDNKLVTIQDVRTEFKLYGMYEEDFIASAMELDENRKPITFSYEEVQA